MADSDDFAHAPDIITGSIANFAADPMFVTKSEGAPITPIEDVDTNAGAILFNRYDSLFKKLNVAIQEGTIATSNNLDQAYDQGGAGAGKDITVDSGPVEMQGTIGSDALGVTGTFFVTGAFVADGGVDVIHSVTGNLFVENDITVTGTVQSTGIVNNGALNVVGSLSEIGDSTFTGDSSFTGRTEFVGVTEGTHVTGSLLVTGSLIVDGGVGSHHVTGNTFFENDLAVTGTLNTTGFTNVGAFLQIGTTQFNHSNDAFAVVANDIELDSSQGISVLNLYGNLNVSGTVHDITGSVFMSDDLTVTGTLQVGDGTMIGSIVNSRGPVELTGSTADERDLDFYIGAPVVRYYTNSGSLVLSASLPTFDKSVMFLIDSTTGASTVTLDGDVFRVVGGGTYTAVSGTVNVFSCYCRNVNPTIIDVTIAQEASGSGGLITGRDPL